MPPPMHVTVLNSTNLIDSDICLQKIQTRGNFINYALIAELRRKFENDASEISSASLANITERVNSIHSELVDDASALIQLLNICSPLHMYGIRFINIVGLLYSFRPRLVRNLYRHYYVKWQESEVHFKQLEETVYAFQILPREFSQLDTANMYVAWYVFIESFIKHGKTYALFFVNHLHTYMLPFN
jgi:hypothetical protein